MSIAAYAEQVIGYLQDNGFEYAEPDRKGGTFPGGILMDLGGGQRVAFFMPGAEIEEAVRSLKGYLEDVYPAGHRLAPMSVRAGNITRLHVYVEDGLYFDEPERVDGPPVAEWERVELLDGVA